MELIDLLYLKSKDQTESSKKNEIVDKKWRI